MAILITGASGFIGTILTKLLLEKGHRVYAVSRHPPEAADNLIPLVGDITKRNLGLIEMKPLKDITVLYHLAGVHTLHQEDKNQLIHKTNVVGTEHVLDFCLKHDINHLFFASTAYTWLVNPYGRSKIQNEDQIAAFADKHGFKATIFKPSIVLGTPENPYPGHFSRFISAIIKMHRRAELIRRKIEGSLRFPVIEPVLRIRGQPEGKLNLTQVDQVAWGMANIKESGTFWLTHPSPLTLEEVAEWVSEVIMVKIKFEPEFKPTPLEAAFQKMAGSFQPYLLGHDFPSNLQLSPPITKELIQGTVKRTVLDYPLP